MTCSVSLAYRIFHNNTTRVYIMWLKKANLPKNDENRNLGTYCHVQLQHGCMVYIYQSIKIDVLE